MRLNVLTSVPDKLFSTSASELEAMLGGPTLVYLPGQVQQPVFISALLHGNELSSWRAACAILGRTERRARSVMLFIGNVGAAAQGVRTLADQDDFNRIWRTPSLPHYEFANELLEHVAAAKPLVAVDIHNNTGKNPHYSVLTSLQPASRGLAYLFSDKAVLVEEPDSVLSRALEQICPAVAVEVGPVGDPESDVRAAQLLASCLDLEQVPEEPGNSLQLYQAVARIHVVDGVKFDFADDLTPESAARDDLILTSGIEAVNFHSLDAGFQVGLNRRDLVQSLCVLDPSHADVTTKFLTQTEGVITLRQAVVPAMFTTDKAVIHQDCLGYLMRRLESA